MLQTNLISFWELEEASGTRIDRVVASGNDLTDNATVTRNPGKVGQAGQFTRANLERLTRADNASLTFGNIDQTFCAWVFLDSKTSFETLISKGTGLTGEYDLFFSTSSDRFRYEFYNGVDFTTTLAVTANNFGSPSLSAWYFIVAWFDSVADTGFISVNDGTANSAAQSSNPITFSAEFQIGAYASGDHMDGRIDQVGLWKRVLTATERTFLFNDGKGVSWQDILRYDAGAGDYQGFPKPKIREAVLRGEL